MIQKIFDWTAGSFFRTIGRLLVFVIIGFLVASLVDFSSIKWTDLLGIETVYADTYIQGVDTPWYYSDKTTSLPRNSSFNYVTQTSTLPNAELKTSNFFVQTPFDISNIRTGYWTAPFYIQAPVVDIDTVNNSSLCYRWSLSSQNNWYCADISQYQSTETDYIIPQVVVQVIESYQNGYTDICEVDLTKNMIKCPVASSTNLTGISFVQVRSTVYYDNSRISGQTYYVGLGRKVNKYRNDTTSIINNQNQIAEQQQQQHNETMSYFQDDNTTSSEDEASSFFDDFSVTDHGGLSSILTAPLTIVSKVLDDTCTPATFTYRNKQVVLPCGQYFWNQAPELRDWLSTIESGIIAYAILVALFKMIQKLESPSNSEVEVESL